VRLAKLAARSRPHYSPQLRFRILEHRRKYMLSVHETTRRFLVTHQTIYNWLEELHHQPDATSIGSTVVPVPPVRRFSDAVRRLVRQMKDVGFGGKKKGSRSCSAPPGRSPHAASDGSSGRS